MNYQAAGLTCALDLSELLLPLTREEIIALLAAEGCTFPVVDVVEVARSRIGRSSYKRRTDFILAPETVNCSTFIKWVYAQRGIWLPKRHIQQREMGTRVHDEADIVAGDLVFWTGNSNFYRDDPHTGVGHVGICTASQTVIHATKKGSVHGVIETPYEQLAATRKLRGITRLVPLGADVVTLVPPASWEVETSDDLQWILFWILKRKK